jgi:hypothetical protein
MALQLEQSGLRNASVGDLVIRSPGACDWVRWGHVLYWSSDIVRDLPLSICPLGRWELEKANCQAIVLMVNEGQFAHLKEQYGT